MPNDDLTATTEPEDEPMSPVKAAILARVQRRLELLGLRRQSASISAGLGPDLVRDWWRKKKAFPTVPSLTSLAPVLKTFPEWLAFGTGPEEEGQITPPTMAVPLISWVAASSFEAMGDIPSDAPVLHQIGLPRHRFLALIVRGDSMNLVAPDGSTIIVDLDDKDLVHRRLYVFRDGGEATFKRFMTNPARLEPVSTNPAHEPIEPGEGVRPLGRVIRVISEP